MGAVNTAPIPSQALFELSQILVLKVPVIPAKLVDCQVSVAPAVMPYPRVIGFVPTGPVGPVGPVKPVGPVGPVPSGPVKPMGPVIPAPASSTIEKLVGSQVGGLSIIEVPPALNRMTARSNQYC